MFFSEATLNLSLKDVPFFLSAIWVTLSVTLISITIGTLIGFLLGLVMMSRIPVVNKLPYIYIEPLRDSPLLVQLFLFYYGLPMITGFSPSSYVSSITVLSLNTGAFIAVVVHAALMAVPKHQWESAYALGHSRVGTFRHVIFRQAFRIFLPAAMSIYISQLQVSSMVSFVGLIDVTRVGQILTMRTFKPFLIWAIVLCIYFVLSYPLSLWARKLEADMQKERERGTN